MSEEQGDYERLREAILEVLAQCPYCVRGHCTALAHDRLKRAASITRVDLLEEWARQHP
jgi:hypothetical protein